MDTSKGYRHLGFNSHSIRDCVQILNAYGGFYRAGSTGPGDRRTWEGTSMFGKLIPTHSINPKEYYDCLVKNDRLNEQKIRQSNQKMRQLTKRVLQLEKL